ncbi:unnamed protein product [marine sediment metagenome]|uniref:Uncharacterized protein n=1 Tax=marine sediment metagenome TaxID=412755 RepID=X1MPS3_9ZZZZ
MSNNIFKEAKQLLATKPVEEMTEGEVLKVKVVVSLLDILPEFKGLTTLEGLENLDQRLEMMQLLVRLARLLNLLIWLQSLKVR